MIIQGYIDVKINNMNIEHFRNKGYLCDYNDTLKVKCTDLKDNSYYKIKVKCDICDKEKQLAYYKYIKNITSYGKYACSQKCSSYKVKLTKHLKYNDVNYNNREKSKETSTTKYGFEYPTQNELIKYKIKETFLKKYETDHPMKNDEIKIKTKETLINKYGTDYIKIIHNKIKDTNNKKYGVNYPLENNIIYNKTLNKIREKYDVDYISQTSTWKVKNKLSKDKSFKKRYRKFNILNIENDFIIIKCDKCGKSYKIKRELFYTRNLKYKMNPCTICNPIGDYSSSNKEKELREFIKSIYYDKISFNDRSIIYPYQLDIFIPQLKLAFEFNGIYWHSDNFKEKNYHEQKSNLCIKNGIKLIHIWEDEWNYNKDYIIYLIKSLINRDKINESCKVTEISKEKIKKFLLKNKLNFKIEDENLAIINSKEDIISVLGFKNKNILYHLNDKNYLYIDTLKFFLKFLNKSMVIERSHFHNYEDVIIINNLEPSKLYLSNNKRVLNKNDKSIHNCGYFEIKIK